MIAKAKARKAVAETPRNSDGSWDKASLPSYQTRERISRTKYEVRPNTPKSAR